MDTYPILDPLVSRQRCVTSHHTLLDDEGAADGFDRTVEHRQKTVAGAWDKLAVVLCEVGLDEFAPLPRHAGVGAFLIKLHQTAVSGNISREDCCKPSHRTSGRRGT